MYLIKYKNIGLRYKQINLFMKYPTKKYFMIHNLNKYSVNCISTHQKKKKKTVCKQRNYHNNSKEYSTIVP